jgi:hypothetical protein
MTLDRFLAPVQLLGAVGMFILAPIQWRAGKKKHFWVMLVCGAGMLLFAVTSFL